MPRRVLALLLLAPLTLAGSLTGLAMSSTPAAAATTIDGPDVSSYQHPNGASINWAAVARSGREFAIVKATEGTSYVNHYFAADYSGIRTAGMVRGSYHFARPARPLASSALAQARFYVRHIGSTRTTKTLPPALDLEVTGGLSRVELITWAQDFLLDVRSMTGRTPMLYTYPWFWSRVMGDPAAFSRYPLWMAAYSGGVDAGATLWQYTAGATVTGIKGKVDMSRLLADTTTWSRLSNGTTVTSWPAAVPGAPPSVLARPGLGAVHLSWLPADAGSRPLSAYQVTLARVDGVGSSRSLVVPVTTLAASFTALTPETLYVATVRGINVVGSGMAVGRTVEPLAATAAAAAGPTSVAFGRSMTLVGAFSRVGTHVPLTGAKVSVLWRPHGTRAWSAAATLVTDAAGRVSLSRTPSRNTDYLIRFDGSPGLAASHVIRTVNVSQIVHVTVSAPSTPVAQPVTLAGWITPGHADVSVASQVNVDGQWRGLQVSKTDSTGHFSFTVTPGSAGTWTYRVIISAMPGLLRGVSPLVAVQGL